MAASFRLTKLSLLRSPILRWSMLAVCAVVVATVTSRHFSRQKSATFLMPEARVSTTYEPSPTAPKKADDLAAKLESPKPDSALSRRRARQSTGRAETDLKALAVADEKSKKDSLPNAVPPTAPSPTLFSKLNDRERRDEDAGNDLQGSAGKAVNGPATNKAVSAMNETLMVENRTASVEVAQATPEKAKEEKATRMKAPAAASGVSPADRVTANQAVESDYAIDLRAALVPLPRWTLSPEGRLQRSLDGGKTWKTIPLSSKTVLRAVSATDQEVWVGGDAGALYHSTDSGQHWTQITPTVNGEPLTSDILRIESTDAHQAKLATSDRETWTTTDGGESWISNK
jgi:Photosynthesis system II assembly factor YCF48